MARAKIAGKGMAVGYWGRDPATHIHALQTSDRVLALNYDKVHAMGLPFRLWTKARQLTPDNIQCSCFKDTTQQSDSPCLSCYGLRYQPGYVRFGYNTVFRSSTHSDLILVGVELNKVAAPFRLQLAKEATVGRIITPVFNITQTNRGQWEIRVEAFARDSQNNVITTEFTMDGYTWYDASLLGTSGYNPTVGGTIQFRVTLARANVTDVSPLFEMLRARYPVVASPRTREPLPAKPGDILILKTWDMEKFRREMGGQQVETEGERFWTLPLSFFDDTIDRESAGAVLGPDHFLEEANGPEAGARYVSTKHSYSRTFKIFTRQEFNLRRVIGQPNAKTLGETIMRVW